MSNTVQHQEFSDVHRKQSTISSALEKIRDGFCLKSDLTAGERGFIFEKFSEATVIEISSVRSRGSKHYSIYDLISQSVKGMVYIVIDHSKFRSAISSNYQYDHDYRTHSAESFHRRFRGRRSGTHGVINLSEPPEV